VRIRAGHVRTTIRGLSICHSFAAAVCSSRDSRIAKNCDELVARAADLGVVKLNYQSGIRGPTQVPRGSTGNSAAKPLRSP
jgi:hypothetical protein